MADILGIYYGPEGPTEAELLAMRVNVMAQMDAAQTGKRFEQVSFPGKSFMKANLTYEQLAQELLEIRAALQKLNPDLYGRRVQWLTTSFDGT